MDSSNKGILFYHQVLEGKDNIVADTLSRNIYEKTEVYEKMDPEVRIIPIQLEAADDTREKLQDIAGAQK